eukprot:scaffold8567_cov277-Pinguiococcus_pyrenoidosus.AAC.7
MLLWMRAYARELPSHTQQRHTRAPTHKHTPVHAHKTAGAVSTRKGREHSKTRAQQAACPWSQQASTQKSVWTKSTMDRRDAIVACSEEMQTNPGSPWRLGRANANETNQEVQIAMR